MANKDAPFGFNQLENWQWNNSSNESDIALQVLRIMFQGDS